MSQLIDRLKQTSQGVPQPIGFRASHANPPQLKLLLIGSLAHGKIDGLADYLAGADAGLFSIHKTSEARVLQEASKAVPEIPLGVKLGEGGQTEMDKVEKSGCDFIVFPAAETPVMVPKSDTVGRVLEVEASVSNGLMMAVNDLAVDCVLVTGETTKGDFLSWHHLMLFQHFASLLSKPLLVPVPSSVAAGELQALWEAGVDGVILDAQTGKLRDLRAALDRLTLPQRKRRKTEALLPRLTPDAGIEVEEEEE